MYYFKEWLKTLSSQKSFFSAKRLERFALFTSAIIICLFYIVWCAINNKLELIDVMSISSAFFIYAGYNMSVTEKAKNIEHHDNVSEN